MKCSLDLAFRGCVLVLKRQSCSTDIRVATKRYVSDAWPWVWGCTFSATSWECRLGLIPKSHLCGIWFLLFTLAKMCDSIWVRKLPDFEEDQQLTCFPPMPLPLPSDHAQSSLREEKECMLPCESPANQLWMWTSLDKTNTNTKMCHTSQSWLLEPDGSSGKNGHLLPKKVGLVASFNKKTAEPDL